MNPQFIGAKLVELRGKTPREVVAVSCGVSYSAMTMYELGKRIPRDEIKVKLAAYYGKSVDELFYFNQNSDVM